MIKSKKTNLIYGILFLTAGIGLLISILVHWNSQVEDNRMRLFIRIIWTVLLTFKAIDYFLEWRKLGPANTEQ